MSWVARLSSRTRRNLVRLALAAGLLALTIGYWLLPIRGYVLISADSAGSSVGVWPQIWLDPPAGRPGEQVTIYVRDSAPWTYVKLLVDGAEISRDESYAPGRSPWTWRWYARFPSALSYPVVFYYGCDQGCVERGRVTLGLPGPSDQAERSLQPTKLGVVFADPARDWHGRAGWAVELTYARRQDDLDFSIDGLARRVAQLNRLGLRVLVRVAYDRRQALPPADDEVALEEFLAYCRRLARDDRLGDVYGYVIGTGFNTAAENALASGRPVTPEWYARILIGYGLDPARADNVIQTMRAANPQARILVGPVAPWNADQSGALPDPLDLPWLNYMNTLVARIDSAAQARAERGIALAAPDGFALRVAGLVDHPALGAQPAQEPATDLRRAEWGAAQAGFRVYRDWLAIINRYPTTRGLPAYITSTNTIAGDAMAPPAQTYPSGWLTSALAEIEREPQVQALCWFVDDPLGGLWDDFSLRLHPGRLHDAADDFDRLLQR